MTTLEYDAVKELLLDRTITIDLLDELFAAVVSEDKGKINKILSIVFDYRSYPDHNPELTEMYYNYKENN